MISSQSWTLVWKLNVQLENQILKSWKEKEEHVSSLVGPLVTKKIASISPCESFSAKDFDRDKFFFGELHLSRNLDELADFALTCINFLTRRDFTGPWSGLSFTTSFRVKLNQIQIWFSVFWRIFSFRFVLVVGFGGSVIICQCDIS